MRLRVVTMACVLPVFTALAFSAAQDTTMRYRWVKGEDLRYRVTQQGTTTMSGLPGGGNMTIVQSNEQVFRLTVADVTSDGGATLQQTFESARMELNSPGGKTVFDSSASEQPTDPIGVAIGTAMSAMVGQHITVVLGPTGAVTKVEGMSNILDKLMTQPQNPMAAQVFSQFKTSFGDDAMRGMFEQGFLAFPDRAVKAGDTWTSQSTLSLPIVGTLTTTRTSTLKGIEGSGSTAVARIAVTIAIKQDANVAPSSPIAVGAKLGDAQGQGEILFDIGRGRVLRSSLNSEMPVTMSLPSPNGGSIDAQTVVRTSMTMALVEK